MKGKQVCLSQEQKFLQVKGKKGKGKNKGKEEEENLAKRSPEYDYVEAREGEALDQRSKRGKEKKLRRKAKAGPKASESAALFQSS